MVSKCHRLPSLDPIWLPNLLAFTIKSSRAHYLSRLQLSDFGFLWFLPEHYTLAPPEKIYSSHQLKISCERNQWLIAEHHTSQQAGTQLKLPFRSVTSLPAKTHPCCCRIWDIF